jgi:RNA polymerase sigma-70 factor (ECF subfamily)
MDAYETIYRRYVHSLLKAAYKRLEDKQQAEDLVQDVFFRLWDKRERLRVTNLSAYLHTAVRYEILNYVSRNKAPLHFYAPFEAVLMETDTPESQLLAKEFVGLVLKYAETLPARRKEVFLLHIKNKLSVKEIAAYLKISEKTVYNHLGIAMNDLRTNITPAILLLLSTQL